jgi:hypothetical protein
MYGKSTETSLDFAFVRRFAQQPSGSLAGAEGYLNAAAQLLRRLDKPLDKAVAMENMGCLIS